MKPEKLATSSRKITSSARRVEKLVHQAKTAWDEVHTLQAAIDAAKQAKLQKDTGGYNDPDGIKAFSAAKKQRQYLDDRTVDLAGQEMKDFSIRENERLLALHAVEHEQMDAKKRLALASSTKAQTLSPEAEDDKKDMETIQGLHTQLQKDLQASTDASAAITRQTLTSNSANIVAPQEAQDVPLSSFLQDSTKLLRSHRNLRNGRKKSFQRM